MPEPVSRYFQHPLFPAERLQLFQLHSLLFFSYRHRPYIPVIDSSKLTQSLRLTFPHIFSSQRKV